MKTTKNHSHMAPMLKILRRGAKHPETISNEMFSILIYDLASIANQICDFSCVNVHEQTTLMSVDVRHPNWKSLEIFCRARSGPIDRADVRSICRFGLRIANSLRPLLPKNPNKQS